MVKPFQYTDDEEVYTTPIFSLLQSKGRHPGTGHEGRYVTINSPDWVNVIALTDDDDVVLIRQWRHGTRSIEVEVPAGIVDPGESPLDAAARELREETGLEARHMRILGTVKPNPAYQNNTCTTVLATGCRKLHDTDFDAGEDIEMFTAKKTEVLDMVRSGTIRHGVVLNALLWWTLEPKDG